MLELVNVSFSAEMVGAYEEAKEEYQNQVRFNKENGFVAGFNRELELGKLAKMRELKIKLMESHINQLEEAFNKLV